MYVIKVKDFIPWARQHDWCLMETWEKRKGLGGVAKFLTPVGREVVVELQYVGEFEVLWEK